MITIETVYKGDLRTIAKHVFSGAVLVTDAPLDNNGKGEAFSPTDLLAASLGSCMLTIMGIAARTHGFNIEETKLEIIKKMATDPRRVAEVQISFFYASNKIFRYGKEDFRRCSKNLPGSTKPSS